MPEEALPNQNPHTTPAEPDPAANETLINNEKPPKKSNIKLILSGAVFVIIVVLFIGAFLFSKDKIISNKSADSSPVANSNQSPPKNTDFFYFSIPKPYENLELNDLPNTFEPYNVIKVNGNIWFAAGGSITEYDPKANKLVSYSNLAKANCDRNILFVNKFIYAACRTDNIDDAFETSRVLDGDKYMGHYSILKIDPKTHEIVQEFNDKDGLKNRYNYFLYEDGDYIWTETFNGIARINTNTNKVDFWDEELGIIGTSYGVSEIFIDKDYVWTHVTAHAESQGGMSLFNKKTGTWTGFGPDKLMDYSKDRFDLDFSNNGYLIKKQGNGIQIAFRDGDIDNSNRLVQKKYDYTTKTWTKIDEFPITGDYFENASKKLESIYPSPPKYTYLDEYGLSQIKIPGTNEVYKIDGRNNLVLSQPIDGKRYVLTNGTLDAIDDSFPFRRLLVKLMPPSKENTQYNQMMEGQNALLIDPKSKLAIITDASCGGMGCTDNHKIWLIDLKSEKLLKTYTATDNIPNGDELFDLNLSNDGTYLLVANKTGYIFKINLKDYSITKVEKTN